MLIAIEVADTDDRHRQGEVLEDGALIDAIAAPGPRQAKDVHLAPETPQQRALLPCQVHLLIELPPALFLPWIGMAGQEIVIREAGMELVEKIHSFDPDAKRPNHQRPRETAAGFLKVAAAVSISR